MVVTSSGRCRRTTSPGASPVRSNSPPDANRMCVFSASPSALASSSLFLTTATVASACGPGRTPGFAPGPSAVPFVGSPFLTFPSVSSGRPPVVPDGPEVVAMTATTTTTAAAAAATSPSGSRGGSGNSRGSAGTARTAESATSASADTWSFSATAFRCAISSAGAW